MANDSSFSDPSYPPWQHLPSSYSYTYYSCKKKKNPLVCHQNCYCATATGLRQIGSGHFPEFAVHILKKAEAGDRPARTCLTKAETSAQHSGKGRRLLYSFIFWEICLEQHVWIIFAFSNTAPLENFQKIQCISEITCTVAVCVCDVFCLLYRFIL